MTAESVARLGEQLRRAAQWVRGAMHGRPLTVDEWLNLQHLIHLAEEASAEIDPDLPAPVLWAIDPPSAGYRVPRAAVIRFGNELLRFRFDRIDGVVDERTGARGNTA